MVFQLDGYVGGFDHVITPFARATQYGVTHQELSDPEDNKRDQ